MKKKLEEVLYKADGYLPIEEICYRVGATTKEEQLIIEQLVKSQVSNYEISEKNGQYILMRKTATRKGIFHEYKNYSVVVCGEQEFVIYGDRSHGALDGDEVLIHIPYLEEEFRNPKKRNKKSQRKQKRKLNEVEVEKIINRECDYLIGKVIEKNNVYYLKPKDKSKRKLKIILDGENFAAGEQVFVKLNHEETSLNTNVYHTTLIEKLNFPNEPEKDIQMEAYKLGIYKGFSNETMQEVENMPMQISNQDKEGKADFTDWEIFTIDGDDTKDIDDAISLHEDQNGNTILGVHIAYPSYYIEEGSATYDEALSKGTSCYPTASRVFPMLHPKLSNGICSLNPNVERLAISYIMTFDKNGKQINYDIVESVIKSNIQMTYKKVNDLLEKGIVHEGYEEHQETLKKMKKLSDKLKKIRVNRGALLLETEELKIELDEEGQVIGINTRHQHTSESIIESFMVASAEAYATFCQENNIPCIYRNHEIPMQIKINKFIEELELCGFDYDEKVRVSDPISLQKLSKFVTTEVGDLSKVLTSKFIRSLQKANFGVKNIGHSGLASRGHSPNTSPIRRGNDFIDQYVLKEMYLSKIDSEAKGKEIEERINGNNTHINNLSITDNMTKYSNQNLVLVRNSWEEKLSSITEHLSQTEVNADRCEREVNKMKLAEAMEKEIGTEFTGIITDFNDNNIFVALDNMIEGRIQKSDLKGRHKYDKRLKYMKGEGNEEDYYLGDNVKVSIKNADKHRKSITFNLEEKIKENTRCKNKIQKQLRKTKRK